MTLLEIARALRRNARQNGRLGNAIVWPLVFTT